MQHKHPQDVQQTTETQKWLPSQRVQTTKPYQKVCC